MRAVPSAVYDTTLANSGSIYFNASDAACSYFNNAAFTASSISWRIQRNSGTFAAGEVCGHTYVRIRLDAEL
jgi:hypothetical protein